MFGTHYNIERNSVKLALAITLVAAIGGTVEIAPLFTIDETVERDPNMRTYTPLELAGRDIYIREGCYACHSQMIRTLKDDVDRYGPYSLAVELKYDHPMLWGSKRTGPDLARMGSKYSDQWHVEHLKNPRNVVKSSIMPRYGWLAENALETESLGDRLAAQRTVGVPYTDDQIKNASEDALMQANPDDDTSAFEKRYGEKTNIRYFDGEKGRVTEMDAVVAYLQILGKLTDKAHEEPAVKGK